MLNTRLSELPYYANSCIYFECIRHESWPIFLDSCFSYSQKGRYDILSAAPHTHLSTEGAITTVTTDSNNYQSTEDPFHLVKKHLGQYPSAPSFLPFNGGALGYFAYDLNKRLEVLPDQTCHDITLPEMSVGIYLWAVIVDHQLKKAYLLQPPEGFWPTAWAEIKQKLFTSLQATNISPLLKRTFVNTDRITVPISNLNKKQYAEKFAQIMQHIRQGDTYQINFAQRWQVAMQDDPWDLYQLLREKNPAPFAAFIPLPQGAILSCSPERFLTVHDREVTTMPIKGTAARKADPIQDKLAAEHLLNSEKNRAENVMIVDLMRNDLGKCCITGSVHVPQLCELQSFINVHHLVSTVCGQLRADKHPLDLLRDCFPGGSITGAPKIRAQELIDAYEPHQRHIYCGSIGYIDFNGHMDTNIAIRTAVLCNQQFYFWAGGGVVSDSQMEQEYQETFDKVQPFLSLWKK